jgi:hypothetical protein
MEEIGAAAAHMAADAFAIAPSRCFTSLRFFASYISLNEI